jgi:hypothetical protein
LGWVCFDDAEPKLMGASCRHPRTPPSFRRQSFDDGRRRRPSLPPLLVACDGTRQGQDDAKTAVALRNSVGSVQRMNGTTGGWRQARCCLLDCVRGPDGADARKRQGARPVPGQAALDHALVRLAARSCGGRREKLRPTRYLRQDSPGAQSALTVSSSVSTGRKKTCSFDTS